MNEPQEPGKDASNIKLLIPIVVVTLLIGISIGFFGSQNNFFDKIAESFASRFKNIGNFAARKGGILNQKSVEKKKTWKDFYEEGENALNSNYYNEAYGLLSSSIKLEKKNADVFYKRGLCAYKLGLYKDAINDYDTAVDMNFKSASIYVDLAAAHIKLKQFDSALADYDKALEIKSGFADALYGKSLCKYKMGYSEQSLDLLSKLKESHPNYWRSFILAGDIYMKSGDFRKAVYEYESGVKLNPSSAELYDRLGRTGMKLRDYKSAVDNFKKAKNFAPSSIGYQINLGYATLKNGDPEKAIELFKVIREIVSNNELVNGNLYSACRALIKNQKALLNQVSDKSSVYASLGYGYLYLPDLAKAKFYSQKAVSLNPNSSRSQYILGKCLLESNDKADKKFACECFTKSIELSPEYSSAWFNRGLANAHLGRYNKAKEDFQKSITLGESELPALLNIAACYELQNDQENEERVLKKAIAAYPNNAKPYFRMSDYMVRRNKNKEGLRLAEKSLQISKDYYRAWNSKSKALYYLGQYKQALICSDEALKREKESALVYINRAYIYYRLGMKKECLDTIRATFRLNPPYEIAYFKLAYFSFVFGDNEECINYCRKMIKQDPKSKATLNLMASAYKNLGEYDSAFNTYGKAIALNPKDKNSYFRRAALAESEKKYEQALKDYDSYLKLSSDNFKGYCYKALVLADMKRFEEAEKLLNQAEKLKAGDAYICYSRAKLAEEKGEFQTAASLFKKCIKVKPDSGWYYSSCIDFYDRRGDYNQALVFAEEYIKAMPEDAAAYSERATEKFHLLRFDEALNDLAHVRKINPKYETAYKATYFNLAAGNWQKALEATYKYEKFPEAKSRDQVLFIAVLGRWCAYSQLGRKIEAEETLRKGLVGANVWPYPIVEHVAGRITQDELLMQASDRDEKTEAKYWAATKLILDGKRSEGKKLLEWVVKKGTPSYYEIPQAKMALKRL